jgi:hypothetical protein
MQDQPTRRFWQFESHQNDGYSNNTCLNQTLEQIVNWDILRKDQLKKKDLQWQMEIAIRTEAKTNHLSRRSMLKRSPMRLQPSNFLFTDICQWEYRDVSWRMWSSFI